MASYTSPLLALPRELRDAIYEQYVLVKGGYVYSLNTGKMRPADSGEQSIDLALMFTCSQIACEMRGIALAVNTLTFRTATSPDLDVRAHFFNELMSSCEEGSIECVGSYHGVDWVEPCPFDPSVNSFLNKTLVEEVSRTFPECQPLAKWNSIMQQESPMLAFSNLTNKERWFLSDAHSASLFWKETPSATRELLRYIIEVAHKLDLPLTEKDYWIPLLSSRNVLDVCSILKPWDIPTVSQVGSAVALTEEQYKKYWSAIFARIGRKCYFSAAACAIKFLRKTSDSVRKHLRNMILHEDHVSVSYPECHAEGLIPFCIENPNLKITRKVDWWHCVSMDSRHDTQCMPYPCGNPNKLSKMLFHWLAETMNLFRVGMPRTSFSLLFDGSLSPEMAAKCFTRIQRDVAWQEIYERIAKRDGYPELLTRTKPCYIGVGFPEFVRGMINDESFPIKCNFSTGESWDVDKTIAEHRNLSRRDWDGQWFDESWRTQGRPMGLYTPFQSRSEFDRDYIYEAERWRYNGHDYGGIPRYRLSEFKEIMDFQSTPTAAE